MSRSISFNTSESSGPGGLGPRGLAVIVALAIGGLITLGAALGSFYTVQPGERTVITRLGNISRVADPGLNFKFPYIEAATPISVRNHVLTFDKVQTYSKDQQPADIRVSVNFEIAHDGVAEVLSEYGSENAMIDRVLKPRVYSTFKTVFGQYTAVTSIQERAKLNADVSDSIAKAVNSNSPIRVTSVQIENIDFSDAYEKSIEQRMLAEVEVQKLRQNAEREKVQAEITVTVARANADAVRQKAMAEAEATKLRGNAEAEAIRARGAALRDNPALIELVQAERWNGVLPTQMIPNSTVPFLNVGK